MTTTCEFCGEVAVPDRVILTSPKVTKGVKGVKIDAGTYVHVCETHRRAIDNGRGWQEREEQARKEREEFFAAQLATNQTELF